jgi:hypothetical protein
MDRLLRPIQVPLWTPLPGPQTLAYHTPADELFYGGAAGGGKSDLLLGLAATSHLKSLILRRESTQLQELIQRSHDLFSGNGKFNGTFNTWKLANGRMLEMAGVKDEQNKQRWKGRAHDLKCFDELSDFTESQYLFITAWNRTTTLGQRCRIVGAGNPPSTAEGEWVIRRWAPWLGAYLRQRPHQENIPQSRPEKTDADAKFKYEDLFFERRRLFSLYQRRRKGHFGFFRIVAKVEFGQFFAVERSRSGSFLTDHVFACIFSI